MAVLTDLTSDELVSGYRGSPVNDHGKLRFQFFTSAALVAEADIGSTVDLFTLPPGKVRILPSLSRIKNSAGGAGATLDIGHVAYQNQDGEDPEAADDDALTPTAIDVAGAADSVALGDALKFDVFSKKGALFQAKAAGANWPIGFFFSGYIAYIYD